MLRSLGVLILWGLCAVQALATEERIVSLAPSLTETLAGIGKGSSVVGVSNQCDFPQDVVKKAHRVGSMTAPSLEAILALRPTHVVATEGNPRDTLVALSQRGVRVVELNARKAAELPGMVRTLGAAVHAQADAALLATRLEVGLEKLRRLNSTRKNHPSFLVLLQLDPIYTVTRETWLGDLVEMSGLRNSVPSGKVAYPQLAGEFVVRYRPDLVLADPGISGDKPASAKEFVIDFLARTFSRKNDLPRVVMFPPDVMVRPGPRLLEGVEFLLGLAP